MAENGGFWTVIVATLAVVGGCISIPTPVTHDLPVRRVGEGIIPSALAILTQKEPFQNFTMPDSVNFANSTVISVGGDSRGGCGFAVPRIDSVQLGGPNGVATVHVTLVLPPPNVTCPAVYIPIATTGPVDGESVAVPWKGRFVFVESSTVQSS
ncbi:MAG: hypothetical protein ACYDDF_06615 [Thermoplasmatota archaeon]